MKRQVLISTLLALAIIMAAPLTVNAQAKSGASGAGPSPFGEDEESYDVESSDTRDTGAKYDEALPLKKKAKVVQKKLYNRKFRWELGPYFGINPADSFVFSIVEGARLNFSFAEMMGVQLVGGYMQSFDRDDTTLLTDTVDNGGLEIDEDFIKNSKTQWFVNADFVWYPAYGKFSLASSVIVNYDVSLYAGAGVMGMAAGFGDEVAQASPTVGPIARTARRRLLFRSRLGADSLTAALATPAKHRRPRSITADRRAGSVRAPRRPPTRPRGVSGPSSAFPGRISARGCGGPSADPLHRAA